MRSGALRHLLTFQILTETKDESDGSVSDSWAYDFKVYGERVSGKADEIFESQRRNALATWPQFVASETYIFKIRHRDGIDSLKHRVILNGKIYGIFPPMEDNRRREMLVQLIFLSANVD